MKNDQYFPHDATASNNLKLMALIEEEGPKGYGAYWLLLEFLRQQENYKGRIKMTKLLAKRIGTTAAILHRIIHNYALFAIDGELFYSPGLSKRMQPLDDKRATKSKQCSHAANHRWQKDSKNRDAGAIQEEKSKEEDSKGKKSKEEDGMKEELHHSLQPPEYALNTETHNYEGLMRELLRLKITEPREQYAILRFSDYGKIGGKVWKLLYHTDWKKIKAPGKFMISVFMKG